MNNQPVKGYKVMNPDMTCRGFQFEVGKTYKHKGKIELCGAGFHFCKKAQHCFNYYSFKPENVVCEVEAVGITEHGEDKSVTSEIKIVRSLLWTEVLDAANSGANNTGHSNSGDSNSGDSNSGNWNSGNWNSGDRNSGDRNSGYRNSGYRNSGYRNSGYRNSGNWNSGNWNSGHRNSGDSNSGYRNSGAFCTDENPTVILFDKPTDLKVKEWENSRACNLMYSLENLIWVPSSHMSIEEKNTNPSHETTGGFLRGKTMHQAWSDMWGNLSESDKNEFTTLPNFDADKFEHITGIKISNQ